jgi:type VI protein secretion system component VasF
MANAPTSDWAWPALIQSLQHDIIRLHETVEALRRDTTEARERHREELDDLIDQLRQVRAELSPIVDDRRAAKEARRDLLWGWIGKGGWAFIVAVAAILWHFLTRHSNE